MMHCKWIGTGFLGVVLSMTCSMAWTAPQYEPQKPAYTLAEFSDLQAAEREQNAQARIRLLDEFAAKYPDSALRSHIYRDYYLTYFSMKNYPQMVEYADKLLTLGDRIDLGTRLEASYARAQGYVAGCGNSALQTPEAYVKAKESAAQGLQMLGRWQKLNILTDEQFAAQKKGPEVIFNSVAGIADSGLKGETVGSCQNPTVDPGRLLRLVPSPWPVEPVSGLQMSIRVENEGQAGNAAMHFMVQFRNTGDQDIAIIPGFRCGGAGMETKNIALDITDTFGELAAFQFIGEPPYRVGAGSGVTFCPPLIVSLIPRASFSIPVDLYRYFNTSGGTASSHWKFQAGYTYSLQAHLSVSSNMLFGVPNISGLPLWSGRVYSNVLPLRFDTDVAAP